MNKALIFWVAILLLFSGSAIAWYAVTQRSKPIAATGQENEAIDYGPPLEDFELTQSTGERFNSEELDGQVWIVNFFYSSCPSICVQENLAVQGLEQEFGHRGVKFLSITCDAANDTPRRLAEYSGQFNADPQSWKFLTGEQQYIERVGEDIFNLTVKPGGHSERLLVIGRDGEIRGAFHFKNAEEMRQLRELVNKLLAEEPPAEQADPSATEPTEANSAEEPVT